MSSPMSGELLDRLFLRFTAIFGGQKVNAMWGDVPRAELYGAWGPAVGRYPMDAIRAAVRSLESAGNEWPPTLSQFCAICAQFNRPEHKPNNALPAPGQSETDRETARANLERIKQMLKGAVKRMPA